MLLCSNCDYWHDGKCKKSPPVLFAVNPSMTNFEVFYPETQATDGCGGGSAIMECEELKLKKNDEFLILKAPDSLTETKILILPNDVGTVGQVLKTDGGGNLSWGSPGKFICRGNIPVYDFTYNNFIHDGEWRTLNLANIVPKGTEWIDLSVRVKGTALNQRIRFRTTNYAANVNSPYCVIQVVGVYSVYMFPIKLDVDRCLQYESNLATACDFYVSRYWQ